MLQKPRIKEHALLLALKRWGTAHFGDIYVPLKVLVYMTSGTQVLVVILPVHHIAIKDTSTCLGDQALMMKLQLVKGACALSRAGTYQGT